jgi:hypothetical protein
MTTPEKPLPTLRPVNMPIDNDHLQLDRALLDALISEDRDIDAFIKRLDYAIADIVRKK